MIKLFLLCVLFVAQVSALNVLTFNKTPYELILCSVTFQVGSDAIVLDSISAYSDPNETVSAAGIIASSPIPAVLPNTSMVVFAIQGGTVGHRYYVSVKAIDTTTGNKMEGTITVPVTY